MIIRKFGTNIFFSEYMIQNIKDHRYILDATRGTSTKTTCPQCGRKKCFKLYVDTETNEYVADHCGRCDHEQSCGYHYTPRQYYQDNAWRQDTPAPKRLAPKPPAVPPMYVTLPKEYVTSRHSRDSMFCSWLDLQVSDPQRVTEVYEAYHVGATQRYDHGTHGTIFWYIDVNGTVHDGKIMWYKPNGHRENYCTWISDRLKKQGLIPDNSVTRKPFFGEHLLSKRPEAQVCVVESEKSALFCACHYPQFVWLATGGCSMLNAEMVRVLVGRNVTFFPDSGELQKWRTKISGVEGLNYRFSEDLEQYPPNTDIVDIYLGEVTFPAASQPDSRRECDRILDAMRLENPDIDCLISIFDLEAQGLTNSE